MLTEKDKEFCINHCKEWAKNNNATQYLDEVLKLLEKDSKIKEAWNLAWPVFFSRYTDFKIK